MHRALTLVVSMGATFALMRAYLHVSPDTDLIIAGYDVHHLFTGVVLITIGGIPAALLPRDHRWGLVAVATFGGGLSLALDEWLYLIVSDGTNASYLLPVSFRGGLAAVTVAIVYAWLIARVDRRSRRR